MSKELSKDEIIEKARSIEDKIESAKSELISLLGVRGDGGYLAGADGSLSAALDDLDTAVYELTGDST